MGYQVIKYPSDLLTYQQVLWQTKPDVLVECGTAYGGSALFFAHIFEMLGHGQVITIDTGPPLRGRRPQHKRITYITGSSVDSGTLAQVGRLTHGSRCMVILDSDHRMGHVSQELEAYCDIVSSGCYLVVEDMILNGHPIRHSFGPGPYEAVSQFMKSPAGNMFVRVPWEDKAVFSSAAGGWLRKKTA